MQDSNACGTVPLKVSVRAYDVAEQLKRGDEPVIMLPAKQCRISPQHKVCTLQTALNDPRQDYHYDSTSDVIRVPLTRYTLYGNTPAVVLKAGVEMGIVASRLHPPRLRSVDRLFILTSQPELSVEDDDKFNLWLGVAYAGI